MLPYGRWVVCVEVYVELFMAFLADGRLVQFGKFDGAIDGGS